MLRRCDCSVSPPTGSVNRTGPSPPVFGIFRNSRVLGTAFSAAIAGASHVVKAEHPARGMAPGVR